MPKKITHIRKPLLGNHEHITHCSNPSEGWEESVSDMVYKIDYNKEIYYVVDPRTGKTAYVGVVKPTNHPPYLRTYADGVWNDNLLSLPNLSALHNKTL